MKATGNTAKNEKFRALHKPGQPFVIPNPWDAGSARILEGLGFPALATTSSGFAMTLGRRDYGVTREQAISHAALIADSVDIPVTADLENGFGADPKDAAETIARASATGLAGGSIEDSTGDELAPVFELSLAVERVSAAAEAARAAAQDFVLTARAEAFLYGPANVDEIINRLNKFADAGADVLYAPGLPDLKTVRTVCASVTKPFNVLILGKLAQHEVAEFADAGAARLSIGGGLAWSAYGTLAAAGDILKSGKFKCLDGGRQGANTIAPFLK